MHLLDLTVTALSLALEVRAILSSVLLPGSICDESGFNRDLRRTCGSRDQCGTWSFLHFVARTANRRLKGVTPPLAREVAVTAQPALGLVIMGRLWRFARVSHAVRALSWRSR